MATENELPEWYKRIDWLRVFHRGSTLVRHLRGDKHVVTDSTMEEQRATKMNHTLDRIARNAVGCTAGQGHYGRCECVICTEERELRR